MDEIETHAPVRHPSPWGIALTCSALVVVLAAGGMLAMYDRMVADAQMQDATQTSAREKLTAQLGRLQSTVDALSSQPAPDGQALATLDAKITDLSSTLDALSARVDALSQQQHPEPPQAVAPVAPAAPPMAPAADAAGAPTITTLKLAVLSGKPFAAELAAWAQHHPEAEKQTFALASIAESGLASESDLNRKLRAALDNATSSKTIDDTSIAGKLNTHLAGLIRIKKTGEVHAYDALRKNVLRDDIATLTRAVAALDDTARAPLEPWLLEARTRRDALEALDKLDAGSGQ
jgi:hypothetical protein